MQERKRIVDLPTVEPDKAEIFRLDYNLLWLGPIIVIVFVLLYRTRGNSTWVGPAIVLSVLLVAGWYFAVYKKSFRKNQIPAVALLFEKTNRTSSKLMGSLRGFGENPESGETLTEEKKPQRPKPIRKIGKIHINAHALPAGKLGWALDYRYNTYSVTVLCKFSSFALASTESQERRLARFADLLDSVSESGGHFHRLVWRDQTFVGEHQDVQRNWEEIRRGAKLTRRAEDCPNLDAVLSGIAAKADDSLLHRTTMTLVFFRPVVDKAAKKLGLTPSELIANHLDSFLSQARGPEGAPSPLGLTSARALTYNNLVLENRLALDPVRGQSLWQHWLAARDESETLSEQIAWPGSWDFEPVEYCRLGETYHRCTYIPGFGARGMLVDQFNGIISVPVRKTVTTVFQMLDPEQGMTHAEVSRAAATNATNSRKFAGKSNKAKLEVAEEEARSFEYEVAYRRGRVGRLRSYIDLWGSSSDEVMAAQDKLRSATVDARFTYEALDGRHHLGIYAAMPFGRGLASPTGTFANTFRWLGM